MNGARPLALVLAALAGCVALASMWPHFAGGQASMPAEVVEGAVLQQDCTDDVSITVEGVYDLSNLDYSLNDPPNYAAGAQIAIYYTVANSSCKEITATVELSGSKSDALIEHSPISEGPCTQGCEIFAETGTSDGVLWNLDEHPNTSDEYVVATVTVTAPDGFVDANPDNNTATSEQWINIVNEGSDPTPDIAVKSVMAPSDEHEAVVGDIVVFTVVVQNEGDADADADTTVTLHLGADTTELDSKTVSALAAGDEETVTLEWDTDEATAGKHTLRAMAQTEGDANPGNDSGTESVTLLEPLVDVAVESVTASATETVVGDTVVFTVTLENAGNVAAVMPEVSLYDADGPEDAEPLETVTAGTIPVGDTKTVTISWDTDNAEAGTYTLRAVATVADDDDPTNDSETASLILHNPVDVALSFTETPDATAIAGNSVSVPFTVANSGTHDAGEVTVSLYVTAEGEERGEAEPEDTRTVQTIAVSDSAIGAFDWDTGDIAVGDYDLEVVAETAGDIDDTNNSVSTSIEIRNWLVLKNVTPTSADAVTGDTVEFTAQVENVGQEDLKDLTVVLSESQVETLLDSATIDVVAAGGTEGVTVEWDTVGRRDVDQVHVFVSVGVEGQVPDEDDTQTASVTLRNPIELSSATLESADNIAGLPVTINVQVLNESNAEVTDVVVKLDAVEDCDDENRDWTKDCATIASIPAGETGAAVLEWDTADVEPGDHELKIIASAAGYGGDANDKSSMTVTLREPVVDVELTSATINRNVAAVGQMLEVTATITNHGEVPVAVPVSLYLVDRLQQTPEALTGTSSHIEPGNSAEVTLQWYTTDTVVGTHMLKVAAELTGDTTTDDNEQIVAVELFPSALDGVGGVESCIEDVGVRVTDIRALSNPDRSPPDYYVGEKFTATYSVYNFSCQTDLNLVLTMNGPEGHAITDPDAPCFASCLVPFGGKSEGEIAWVIPTLPALSDQPIMAAVTVVSPNDFADANDANNSHSSGDRINIVHPDDIRLYLGEEKGNKVSTRRTLTGPEFGAVDVRLVSVHPTRTTLPFAADTVEFVVAAANDGPATEPAAVRFILAPDDGADPLELRRHTMVIPTGQTSTETIEVPLNGVLPGDHTIAVLLSAAVDQSPENNAATVEINRVGPVVHVEMLGVSVSPDVLILGDDATVSLAVRNESEIALPLSLELYVDDDTEPIGTKTIDELAPDGQFAEQISWRIPASAQMLGPHTLKLMASSGDFGALATTELQVTFRIDAEIVGINTTPADTAMRGEKVAIEVEVQNNGPAAVNVPVTLHFPSATKNPETDHAPTPARSTGTAAFTWKTRDYSVGDHMLTATVPEQHNIAGSETSMELPFRVTPLAVTATIVDVSVYPERPSVGEPVSIVVTVSNDGPVATRIPITLHFPPGGRQPQTRSPHVHPGQTETDTFEWLTSNYRPGKYRFLTEVAAVNSPQWHFTVDLLPTVENVAIVGMGTYPVEAAMVGEPVEVWVDVRNDGPVAINVPVQLTFPSNDKKPEQDSERIEPGAIARYSFTWRTSNYEPGTHTLQAAIALRDSTTLGRTTDEIRFTLTPLIINATIVDVSVNPKDPRVGDPVTITVTVRNDGRIAANIPVTLHFPPGGRQPGPRSPRVDVGEIGEAVFTWHTSHYEPGMHDFRVEVASEPPAARGFTVELLPPIVDVAIVGMGSDPGETAVQGQEVKIWADVINNGPSARNVPVQLDFPSIDKQPERRSPRIEPGEIVRVEFAWKTANYHTGMHTLTVMLLAEHNVTELDTFATIQISLVPAPLIASIAGISWTPESPVVGEPVRITMRVRNDSLVAANIPITLHYPSGDKQPETRRPRIDAGAIGTIAFTWRTSRYEPGNHVFVVEVASEPPSAHEFSVELLPPVVDVSIVAMGSDPGETAVQGQEVTVWVDVINNGPSARNVPVQLGFPSGDKQSERRSPWIEPGETVRVEFTWKTANYDTGVHILTAEVLAEYNITELGTSATIQIRLVSPRLAASIVDVSWEPESPVVGERVSITVTVRNNGSIAANIPVKLYFPSGNREPQTRRPRVAPGAVGSASFTWRTSRYEPGDHLFRVQIPGVAGAVRTFEIELRPPEVDFAVVDFKTPDPLHPIVKGDWVEITVVVQNQGPYAGRGTVYLLNAANLDAMYEQSASMEPGEFREVKFIWKTLRYPVGEYDLLVRVNAEHDADPDNDHSGPARVHLLTDRDITVGFGNSAQPSIFAGPTSNPGLRSTPQYPNEIRVTGGSPSQVDTIISLAPSPAMDVPPTPTGGNYDPARMYWRWRAAQISPWECAQYQQKTWESLPRAVVCPKAPALVR